MVTENLNMNHGPSNENVCACVYKKDKVVGHSKTDFSLD